MFQTSKKLVAQPVNGIRNKAYGLHPQFLVDGSNLTGSKSFYLKENPATMVLASPTQVSTANSGQTVSRTIQSSQIMKPATLNKPLQTKNILLNKSASPTSNNVPPTQVRNADGSAREGTTPMHSALGTTTGATQTRQIIQSSNQPTQNNQPTHLVYDAHARPQQIIRSNIIQNKHPITIHQTMPPSAGQQVIYYAGNPHGGAQALFQFASGPTPRIIQQVMTTNPSSDNNNYQQKFPFCVVPHPQTQPTQASHVTSSHGTPIATVATTTAAQHHQQQQFNEISQRVPILNRKRPTQTQNGVILTHQRSPPTLTTQPTISNSSNENRGDQTQTGQPPAKQPKLEDSSNSVHIKVAQGGNIKYESSSNEVLTNQNRPIIRSPSRGSRRKQILDSSLVFSPVTSGSPSSHHHQQQQQQPSQTTTTSPPTQKTPTPDKLIDEASTDEAEECEDEPPKMKMQLENPNYPLPPYRKVSKINQSNARQLNGTTDRADQIKPPRAIRTPKPRPLPSSSSTSAATSSKSSSVSHNNESSGKQNTRIYMNGYDFKAERSSTLHFMCSDDVKHDSGHVFDPKLNLKQLKDHSRCCFYKLNLLNKELSSCQANQRHLQDQFQRRKHKECIQYNLYIFWASCQQPDIFWHADNA